MTSPENVGQQMQKYYHASWGDNRESILRNGLRASQPWDDHLTGVRVGRGMGVTRGYGHDIYEISLPADERVHEDEMEDNAYVIPRDVSPNEIKLVGSWRGVQYPNPPHVYKEGEAQ